LVLPEVRAAAVRSGIEEVWIGIRPEHLVIERNPDSVTRNVIKGIVEVVEPQGGTTILQINIGQEKIPTYEQVVRLCRELGLWANVEIKPAQGHERATGKAVAALSRDLWRGAPVLPELSSFSIEALEEARAEAPERSTASSWAESRSRNADPMAFAFPARIGRTATFPDVSSCMAPDYIARPPSTSTVRPLK